MYQDGMGRKSTISLLINNMIALKSKLVAERSTSTRSRQPRELAFDAHGGGDLITVRVAERGLIPFLAQRDVVFNGLARPETGRPCVLELAATSMRPNRIAAVWGRCGAEISLARKA